MLAASLMTGAGCTSVEPGAAGDELRFHNWWNFYARGRQRLAQGRMAEAAEDFERCVGLKPGAAYGWDRDLWRVRTYGVHVVEECFPNRELGICLYELGQNDRAIRHLEKSLKQQPSGRAKHYLNLARRRDLAGRGVPPPQIAVSEAAARLWTRERNRRVAGTARADGYVSRLLVNGRPRFIELAERELAFDETVALAPGTNVVVVEAGDLAGQRAEQRVVWIADWQPPELVVTAARPDGDDWVVTGSCRDDRGLARVTVDAVPAAGPASEEGWRAAPVRIRLAAGRDALLVAEDLAGNRLQAVLSPAALAHERNGERAAGACQDGLAQAGAADAGGPGPAAEGGDRLKPSLRLSAPAETTEVLDEEFFLDGTAADGGGLASLTINGEELIEPDTRGAVRRYFARRLPLDYGTNRFEIAVRDAAGNRNVASLTVVRRDPEYLDEELRLSMGVPPLTGSAPADTAQRVKRSVESELLRKPVRFHLLERDEGWDFILREQRLSLSDLSDPRVALRIGKMLPAELLLMGSLLPAAKGLTVHAKVVETGNGQVLFSEDVYSEGDARELEYQVGGLVMKIEQRFPLVDGDIVEAAGGKATLNIGAAHGVIAGTRFVVVRRMPGSPDVRAGQVFRVEGRPVELWMNQVRRAAGVATVVPPSAAGAVREGDHAYAR
jgi:tetratricopeptide (TPR) repeat protein